MAKYQSEDQWLVVGPDAVHGAVGLGRELLGELRDVEDEEGGGEGVEDPGRPAPVAESVELLLLVDVRNEQLPLLQVQSAELDILVCRKPVQRVQIHYPDAERREVDVAEHVHP